jgi:hypothetical protein
MPILIIFTDSFALLRKQPKLFLPKIIVAFLYGLVMLITAEFTILFFDQYTSGTLSNPMEIISFAIVLLILDFAVFFVDVFTNALYPKLISDFFNNKKISLMSSAKSLRGKIIKIFLSMVFIEMLLAVPLSLIGALLVFTQNFFVLVIFIMGFLIFYLVLTAVFYFIYPVAVLQENFFLKLYSTATKLSRKKISKVLLLSVLPFLISVFSFVLAFLARNPGFLLLFIIMRFLMAFLQTYHWVLNPTAFLKYDEI